MDAPSSAMPSLTLRVSNLIMYAVLIVVNSLAMTGVLGPGNARISKNFETPLTPSGWAFSIWGLIFLLQGIGTIYALVPQGYTAEGSKQRVVNAIGAGWILGWAAESGWQLSFVRQDVPGMWLCLALLLTALASFAFSLRRLYALRDDFLPPSSSFLYVATLLPTSVNTAWLSVASCLGVLVVPRAYAVDEAHLVIPALLLAALVTLAGMWVVLKKRDTAYGVTMVWAFLAVFGNKHHPTQIRVASFVCVVLLTLASLTSVLPRKAEGSGRGRGIGADREPLYFSG